MKKRNYPFAVLATVWFALLSQAEVRPPADHRPAMSRDGREKRTAPCAYAGAATNRPPALTATKIPLDQALRKAGAGPSRLSLDLRAAMPAGPWAVSADPDYLERHEHDMPYYPPREEFISYTGVKVSF